MSDSLVSNRTVTGNDRGDEAWQGEGVGMFWGRVAVSGQPQIMNKGNTFKLHTKKAVQEMG